MSGKADQAKKKKATTIAKRQKPSREVTGVPRPDVSHLIIQDDTPVDNLLHEKQMRLLTEPLYSSWVTEKPFLALANVGLFHEPKQTPVVPDVMLSLDISLPPDWTEHKEHLSYFVWERGKAPDVVIEIISDKRGGERGRKLQRYAMVGVPFYVIYDPALKIQSQPLVVFMLVGGEYETLPPPAVFKRLGLGLTFWHGTYEAGTTRWLRWTLPDGTIIPTGAEAACKARTATSEAQAHTREAEAHALEAQAHARAAETAVREARSLADSEKMRADAAERRIAQLEAQVKKSKRR